MTLRLGATTALTCGWLLQPWPSRVGDTVLVRVSIETKLAMLLLLLLVLDACVCVHGWGLEANGPTDLSSHASTSSCQAQLVIRKMGGNSAVA